MDRTSLKNYFSCEQFQLYLIWFGDATLNEDAASIGGALGAVALRSGGEIFRITEEPLPNGEVGLVIILPSIIWCESVMFASLLSCLKHIRWRISCKMTSKVLSYSTTLAAMEQLCTKNYPPTLKALHPNRMAVSLNFRSNKLKLIFVYVRLCVCVCVQNDCESWSCTDGFGIYVWNLCFLYPCGIVQIFLWCLSQFLFVYKILL